MAWYHYVSGFWSGAFLANFVPHFVTGVCGNRFPTPFAKPRGKGPSSPVLNVVWALFNLVVSYLLFRVAKLSFQDNLSMIIFFAGFALLSILTAKNFAGKEEM